MCVYSHDVILCVCIMITGRPVDITWTLLAETATSGSTEIHLQIPPPWRVGDHIVLGEFERFHSQSLSLPRCIPDI